MAKKALATYREKRDFSNTVEPRGERAVVPSKHLRFVVQRHAARALHYDLRLELDGVFKSWAVTRGPSDDPRDKRLAVEVEDHPLDYGDFEGTIPAGEYGGGTVQLWDRGYWTPEGSKSPEEALRAGDLKFTLDGKRLHGSWVLVRMKRDRSGGKRSNWLLIKHRDVSARSDGGKALLAADRSVASGSSMQEIAAGTGRAPTPFMLPADPPTAGIAVRRIPEFVEPQLCRLVDRPPSGADWVHEIKYDGYRLQVRVVNGAATCKTRTGLDWTPRFAALADEASRLPDCLIDGEVAAFDRKGLPNFAALQAALAAEKSDKLVFFAFDLLFEGRTDLRKLPLAERKTRLEQLLSRAAVPHLRYAEHVESNGDDVLRSACKLGLEGVVSKRLDAPYSAGRSDRWRKAKCRAGNEVVLGGWTTESGTVRALLAGVYRAGRLVYVGRIGTGFARATTAQLLPQLKRLTCDESPFSGPDAPAKGRDIRWLKPKLVAEIEFAGWTGSGMIRQASFKGLRQDKSAREVVAEEPAHIADPANSRPASSRGSSKGASSTSDPPATKRDSSNADLPVNRGARAGTAVVMGVPLSNPDKVLWPASADAPVTKLDLALYSERVGPWMLPHIKGRPCSLLRAPDGLHGTQFFQRHAMAGTSKLLTLVKLKGDRAPYVQIDRLEALAAVAQMGALELHPWNCAPDAPEVAGRLVLDLDPAPDVDFGAVIEAALELRQRLEAVGLEAYCKTTGGKGLHVVTPLLHSGEHAVAWPAAKNFAHVICAQMVSDSPEKYLDTMSKSRRVGRIFLDYLRNDRTATAVAPLSPRAREGATVSMPLNWREVKPGLDPKEYTVRTAPAALAKAKPWSDYDASARSLVEAIWEITRPAGPRAARRRKG